MSSPVVSVGPDATLAEIASAFAAGGFGGVPVLDPTQAVIGFVSELDLMAALLQNRPLDTPARALMSSPLVSVDEFDRTEEVIRILRGQRIHHLPVLRAGRLVGIITPSDVIRFIARDGAPPPKEAG